MITTSGRAPACPVCGAPGATCGSAHVLRVLDVPAAGPTQRRERIMPIDNYDARTPGGYPTVLRLTPEGAAKRGLTDADKTSTRAAAAARNAARTSTSGSGADPEQLPALSTTTADLAPYKLDAVKAYLEGAGDEERARIIALEQARGDKARKTILEWTPPAPPS